MDVAEVLPDFASAFEFESFNRMQREALPALLEAEANVVASAPTASGKTALAELAMCRTLEEGGRVVFVAPLRALTSEKERQWQGFEDLGYSVYVVTGDRDVSPRRARRADVLVMTPEKLDSATRKHASTRYDFVTDVDLCVIDEVHLLDSPRRGPALEATIARLRRLCEPRIVALSATMRNVEDVAAWLDAPAETTLDFGESYRPVELNTGVKTYSPGENAFADKYRRLYRALDLAEPHLEDDGQALVFVASRRDTVRAAEKARDELAERDVRLGARGDYDVHAETRDRIEDETLRQCIIDGVAFHHAGLSRNDRDLVEAWFAAGRIDLLFSTTTLAWGVNLPARCVVLRDTTFHDPLEGEVAMNALDVLQMLGRAGRPGYDDVGYGWVVCEHADADRYRRLLKEGTAIESRLAGSLAEHLNAEVALGTVTDRAEALEWLASTYFHARGERAPEEYGFADLEETVTGALEELIERGFARTVPEREGAETQDGGRSPDAVEPTALGRLTSRYYLQLDTAERFHAVATGERRDGWAMLQAVAEAAEFDRVSARQAERDAVAAVLGRWRGRESLDPVAVPPDERVHGRRALPDPRAGEGGDGAGAGRSDAGNGTESGIAPIDGAAKVLAVLLAGMEDATPADLRGDAWAIRENASRLLAALQRVLLEHDDPVGANRARRLEARIEYGIDPAVLGLTAIPGIGAGRAERLGAAGIETIADLARTPVDDLVSAGIGRSRAAEFREEATEYPVPAISWPGAPDSIDVGETDPHEVTIRNDGAPGTVGIRVTVNGVAMTATETYLRESETVTLPVFGAPDEAALRYRVTVAVPDEPLRPVVGEWTVDVR